MKSRDRAFKQRGQTLIEVLIALIIVTLVLTTVVVAVVLGISSSRFSRNKSRAAFLAQEGMEWLRGQRNQLGWVEFASWASPSGAVYCLDTLTMANPAECAALEVIEGMFTREFVLTLEATGDVEAFVQVAWFEGQREFISDVTARLAQWDVTN